MKNKSDAFGKFKEWKVMIETQSRKKVKRLRIDNGLEFWGDEFTSFCKDNSMIRHHIVKKTPPQNGLAERANRTIMEKTICMLSNPNLSKVFWA